MIQRARIRPAVSGDAASLAALAGELGYPTTAEQMQARLQEASIEPHHGIFIAEVESIVGWIHVSKVLSLETGVSAEIRGLVVAESGRGGGIGTLLVAAAEQWAMTNGLKRIRVRTNVVREKALEFYAKLGYQKAKRQEVLEKVLTSST